MEITKEPGVFQAGLGSTEDPNPKDLLSDFSFLVLMNILSITLLGEASHQRVQVKIRPGKCRLSEVFKLYVESCHWESQPPSF